jgi:acyl-coenzyme A thioesterase PaaI-like protein
VTITHHELCFGCGIANLFGLQMEVEPAADGEGVSGRFFVKQDHQGPPGYAHGGVVACALDEAMALCVHDEGRLAMTGRLAVDFRAPVPVGTFVRVEARVARREGRRLELSAEARGVGGDRPLIAEASAAFVVLEDDRPEGEPRPE